MSSGDIVFLGLAVLWVIYNLACKVIETFADRTPERTFQEIVDEYREELAQTRK